MDATYTTLANFAQTGGLLYFMAIFAGVVVYAVWPSNKEQFDAAKNIPLREDD
ncbi:cbb3-type cytochrome c oxidase subunit 3 [Polycladidibacter hongkongensis]|uniref:cbb3-type cytochrome c oxidase subunit 3 n=1 Tax=Polycladidibacter hongkongensis TaxID=1647556 RepID=UPI0008327D21|nr:cbb3-type cytochrome c oxidase subunit 3 [Pseudovibrio hongkongensis]